MKWISDVVGMSTALILVGLKEVDAGAIMTMLKSKNHGDASPPPRGDIK
jgi:hypothetical protein